MERRRHYRIPRNDATALIVSDKGSALYGVRDFSHGGMLLHGERAIPVDTDIRVLLSVPGFERLWLDGTVRRAVNKQDSSNRFALEFTYLTDDDQDLLSEMLLSHMVQNDSPLVLVGNTRNAESAALSQAIQTMGFRPVVAETPLCMIRHLSARTPRVIAVVLGTLPRSTTFMEMGSFLSETYPETRKILVAPPRWRKKNDVVAMFDTIVSKPWTVKHLGNALLGNREQHVDTSA